MLLEMTHGILMTRKVPATMLRRLLTMKLRRERRRSGPLGRAFPRTPPVRRRATKIAPSGEPSMNKGVWYRLFHCSHCKIPLNANTPTIPLSRQADRPRVEPPPPSEQKNPDEGGRQEPEMQKVACTILAEGERNAHFEQLPSKSRSRDVVYSFSEETSNGIQCPVIDRFIGDPPVQRSISDQIRNQDGGVHLFIHMGVIAPFSRDEGMPEGVPVTGEMPTVHHEGHQDDSHPCTPQLGPAPIPHRADDSTEP